MFGTTEVLRNYVRLRITPTVALHTFEQALCQRVLTTRGTEAQEFQPNRAIATGKYWLAADAISGVKVHRKRFPKSVAVLQCARHFCRLTCKVATVVLNQPC
ncbi:hypothetical protein V5799_004528 [Amblyomma americanum]|uniref:Uncharacterized protein n=1 Tax=Amblyomma americanum TaxID=6943 RepID=A0AAQ4D5V0_AMBAM